jgi:7,8-dihydropterin-6-yl-methyl-4-(beta-D-ribofuranosyl)aminobenzene 5'-phosphate synthase
MKINVLTDNHALRNFDAEWGLSMFIEFEGKTILMDYGNSDLFIRNGEKLGLDVLDADYFVLSHGHWDHGNGLKYLPSCSLICHPGSFINRYRGKTYLGLPYTLEEAQEKYNLVMREGPLEIFKNAYFIGGIPRLVEFESKGTDQVLEDGSLDLVEDDSGIVFKTEKGIVVISGCAHAGICNTIEYAKKITNTDKVYAVIGGFHLKGNDEVTNMTIEYLKSLNIEYISTSHCTRFPALVQFANEFGSKPFESGQVIEL